MNRKEVMLTQCKAASQMASLPRTGQAHDNPFEKSFSAANHALQGRELWLVRGLVNFATALAYPFCPALPSYVLQTIFLYPVSMALHDLRINPS